MLISRLLQVSGSLTGGGKRQSIGQGYSGVGRAKAAAERLVHWDIQRFAGEIDMILIYCIIRR